MSNLYREFLSSNISSFAQEMRDSGGIDNPTFKGRAREIFVGELLRPFLSPTMDICTGTIVDSAGNQSRQIDIIIYDRSIVPPVLFTQIEGFVPIESVLGTIEVKSTLTNEELDNAVANARSVKALEPFFAEMHPGAPVKKSPVCYVYAYRTDLKAKAESDRLRQSVAKHNTGGQPQVGVPLSGICILNGSYTRCIKAEGRPKFQEIAWTSSVNTTMLFIANVIDYCNLIALQRGRIFIHRYFFDDDDL